MDELTQTQRNLVIRYMGDSADRIRADAFYIKNKTLEYKDIKPYPEAVHDLRIAKQLIEEILELM